MDRPHIAGVSVILVDPRERAGVLNKRLRKKLRRSGKSPFSVVQACFDADFDWNFHSCRAGGQGVDPLAGPLLPAPQPEGAAAVAPSTAALARQCSVVVALHPDEATEAAVVLAVTRRLPFAVVPCCVFSRLFSDRRIREPCGPELPRGQSAAIADRPGRQKPVTTYEDLLLYLQQMHPAICRATIPGCGGKNTVLYVASAAAYDL